MVFCASHMTCNGIVGQSNIIKTNYLRQNKSKNIKVPNFRKTSFSVTNHHYYKA